MVMIIRRVMSFDKIDLSWGAVIGVLVAFFAPVVGFLVFTLALVVCDTVTGIMAARKRKEKINSRGLRRTTEKFVVYALAIGLAHGFIETFEVPLLPLTYIVSGWIALHELKSNFENIQEVSGLDLWSKIKDVLPKFGKKNEKDPTGPSSIDGGGEVRN